MLPNLLDDLLKAWDSKATVEPAAAEPVPPSEPSSLEASETITILEAAAVAEAEPSPIPVSLVDVPPAAGSPPTPMDDLLSSLLASFSAVPEPEPVAAVPLPPEPEPVVEEPVAVEEPVTEDEPVVVAEPPVRAIPVAVLPVEAAVPEEVEFVDDSPLPPPPPIRERETLEPIAPPQPAPAKSRKFVAVSFGRHKLAFSIDSVIEAGRYPQTTFVPGLPAHIRGVFAFRGSVLPVVDTRLLTGAPERFLPHECRVLTLQSGNAKAAFIFDTLEGIVNLDPENMLPLRDDDGAVPMRAVLTGTNAEDALGQRFGIADAARLLDLAGCLKERA